MIQNLQEDPDRVLNTNDNTYVTCHQGPTISFLVYRNKDNNKYYMRYQDGRGEIDSESQCKFHKAITLKLDLKKINYDEIIRGRIWPNKKIVSTYEIQNEVLNHKDLIEKLFKDLRLNINDFVWDFANSSASTGLVKLDTSKHSDPLIVPSEKAKKLINHLIQKIHIADPIEKNRLRNQIKILQQYSGVKNSDVDDLQKTYNDRMASKEKTYGSMAAAQYARGSIAEANLRIYNKTLDPNLWNEKLQLDPQVRKILLQIAEDFYSSTDLQGEIVNIFFIGSSANYNWTPESDIDIHVIINISQEKINPKYARKFMDGLTWGWNSEHEIEAKGHPIEVYLQDQTEPNGSKEMARPEIAIFSLKDNEWVQKPTCKNLFIDKDKIKAKYHQIKSHIEKLTSSQDYSGLKSLMKKIKNYRNSGLKSEGEFGTENLVFKALRHTGMLEKLKNGIQLSYDKNMSLNEIIGEKTYVITGMTAQDLDVVGEKYSQGGIIVTHGALRSIYGNWSGSQDWRYRSDINTIFWWGLPDEDERQATKDWLLRKYNVSNPKEESAKGASDKMKDVMHYPWVKTRINESTSSKDSYYVVGVITSDFNVISKRYGKRENYITHDQLCKQYGIDFGSGVQWRYHSIGNWIFWWETPTTNQKEEVKNYLYKKFGIVDPKEETSSTMIKTEVINVKLPFIIIGLVNEDLQVVSHKDFGNGDGKTKIDHSQLPILKKGSGYPFYRMGETHWRYKSKNNTLYIWPPDVFNEKLKDSVLDHLHTKYNVVNPTILRDREEYFDQGHYINEIICEEGKQDLIIFGNIDDDLHINNVKKKLPSDLGSHYGEGKRWRLRTTIPIIFWWEKPTEEEKESVSFYLNKKFGIKIDKHKFFPQPQSQSDWDIFDHIHGDDTRCRTLPNIYENIIDEMKFNPFKTKELQFVTYGGLSLTKQHGFDSHNFLTGSVSLHKPPTRKGIYAFVWPYIDQFLLGGYADPKERGKGQRNRIQYVKDKEGNVITKDHPEYEKLSNISKNWSFSRNKEGKPWDYERDKNEDDYKTVLYRNTNRKKFSYNGPLWHHLESYISQDKILDKRGMWVKTDMETFIEALKKELHQNLKFDREIGKGKSISGSVKSGGVEHLEVFIDQKI